MSLRVSLLSVIATAAMAMANVYLALRSGLTICASVPAAVLATVVLRRFARARRLHAANLVQTMASAGEATAAGAMFTLPAFYLLGVDERIGELGMVGIAFAGGLLGVVLMAPLRRFLLQREELIYPEGRACATILESSDPDDRVAPLLIAVGTVLGATVKFASSGLGWLREVWEHATFLPGGHRPAYFGAELSPALVGVGYLIGLGNSLLVFLGGAIGWFFVLPWLSMSGFAVESALDAVWSLWSDRVRYVGVGCMLVGTLAACAAILPPALVSLRARTTEKASPQGEDIPSRHLALLGFVVVGVLTVLAAEVLGSWPLAFIAALVLVLCAYPFVLLASYIVGIIGSSNTPASGLAIVAIIAAAGGLHLAGATAEAAIVATLTLGGVVCCAVAAAADCSQDLKTGQLIGAAPRPQQWAQLIGVALSSLLVVPTMIYLVRQLGLAGTGGGLRAPQAEMISSLLRGLYLDGNLPYDMIALGVAIGLALLILDGLLRGSGSKRRVHVTAVAIGIYLPLAAAIPVLLGGLLRAAIDRGGEQWQSRGELIAAGLIAGEALVGIVIPLFA